ncbi:MAG: hypothetical protein JXC33_02540 [Deltaproteobacteria bacterium]|nr:hypothetical protein [Deltaproteobacteria bacterium]
MMSVKYTKQVLIISIICLMTCAVCPTTANAHSPGSVTLDYNIDTKVLSVTISHSVSNAAKHYVDKIKFSLNGELIKTFEYTSQPDNSTFTYQYSIEAKEGDTLEVKAECNYFGSRTAKLIVHKGSTGASQ